MCQRLKVQPSHCPWGGAPSYHIVWYTTSSSRPSNSSMRARRRASARSAELPGVPDLRAAGEACLLVGGSGSGVTGVAARRDDREVEAAGAHLVEGAFGEQAGDSTPLRGRIDGDHVDLAAAFRLVERDVDEADHVVVADTDPGGVAAEGVADRVGLVAFPVRVDTTV